MSSKATERLKVFSRALHASARLNALFGFGLLIAALSSVVTTFFLNADRYKLCSVSEVLVERRPLERNMAGAVAMEGDR